MNTEQLQSLMNRVVASIEGSQAVGLVAGLRTAFEGMANNQGADYHTAADDHLQKISALSVNSVANDFSARERAALAAMGANLAIGENLTLAVQQVVAQKQVTPLVAAQEFKRIGSELSKTLSAAKALLKSMSDLNMSVVSPDPVVPDELGAEFALYIPRRVVESSLTSLKKEVQELDMLIESASRLRGSPDYRIVYLSASDFGISLRAAASVVAFILQALERLAALVKHVAELRRISRETKVLGKETRAAIEKDTKFETSEHVLAAVEAIATELIGSLPPNSGDAMAKFTRSATVLARKIQDGFEIDVRLVHAPSEENQATEADLAADLGQLAHRVARLEASIRELPALPAPANDTK